jgi:L-ascorbate metabolism protein UlaG (beta-lactamase superfamily)
MSLNRDTRITWLGHATFLVQTPGGKRIVIDPFLRDNPKCPPEFKTVDKCDLILLTHAHSDHIDDAMPLAEKTGAPIVAIVELGGWLQSKGAQNVVTMNKGGNVRFGDINITMVNAFHTNSIQDGEQTLYGGTGGIRGPS